MPGHGRPLVKGDPWTLKVATMGGYAKKPKVRKPDPPTTTLERSQRAAVSRQLNMVRKQMKLAHERLMSQAVEDKDRAQLMRAFDGLCERERLLLGIAFPGVKKPETGRVRPALPTVLGDAGQPAESPVEPQHSSSGPETTTDSVPVDNQEHSIPQSGQGTVNE